jgi:hypothetical protein
MVWREEEILATELMSKAIPSSKFYILSRGRHQPTTGRSSACLPPQHAEGLSEFPDEPRRGHARDPRGDRRVPGGARRALHHVRSPAMSTRSSSSTAASRRRRRARSTSTSCPTPSAGQGPPTGRTHPRPRPRDPGYRRRRRRPDLHARLQAHRPVRHDRQLHPRTPDGKGGGIPGLSSGVERELTTPGNTPRKSSSSGSPRRRRAPSSPRPRPASSSPWMRRSPTSSRTATSPPRTSSAPPPGRGAARTPPCRRASRTRGRCRAAPALRVHSRSGCT